jgi:hypothetical protein
MATLKATRLATSPAGRRRVKQIAIGRAPCRAARWSFNSK